MTLVRPFPGLRPTPDRAAAILAPPYDTLNTEEARDRAEGNPFSFLHVSKPEIDLPPGTDPYSPAVYAKAAENFRKLIDAGALNRDERPGYYVYRQRRGDHVQTGLVGAASVAAYESGRIRKHEHTQPKKEDDRVRQIEAVESQTGPVLLMHPPSGDLARILAGVVEGHPAEIAVVAEDGVEHESWPLFDEGTIAEISGLFDGMHRLYIADGHHRSAAAARVARAKRGPGSDPDAPHEYFLSVLFPWDQLHILDYNRLVRDLGELDSTSFLAAVAERFQVTSSPDAVAPASPRRFGLYLPGRWYQLSLETSAPETDPVAALDVSLLSDHLIGPVLGIEDQRRDSRIDFVGGVRGLAELERRVDSGEMAAAFSFHPTSVEELIRVADADRIMPTKSTWFEPKLADGLVSHLLD